MSIDKTRSHVVASIWQAIAQSGVDLSSVPQEEQEKLVRKIADTLLVTVDKLLEEASPGHAPVETLDEEGEETLLWSGRPFLSLVESYVITNERLKVTRGILNREIENFELVRMQDIDLSQNMSERMLGIGDITIRGADLSTPTLVLRNIAEPEKVYEILRRAWLESRKKHGLQFRDIMS